MRWPWELFHRGRLQELEQQQAETQEANRRLDEKLQEKEKLQRAIKKQLEANGFIERIDKLFRGDE